MKIKKFNEDKPQIGDYAIADTLSDKEDFKSFLNNTIGKIYYITDITMILSYDPQIIPKNIIKHFSDNPIKYTRQCDRHLLRYFGKTKEEVITKMTQNKYNL